MFTFTIFALGIAVILTGLIAGLDYFSAPKVGQKKIRDDFRRVRSLLTDSGPKGLEGPFEDLSETVGNLPASAEIGGPRIRHRQKKLSAAMAKKKAKYRQTGGYPS